MTSLLVDEPACPACAAPGGTNLNIPMRVNRYETILKELGAPLDKVSNVRCDECGSVFRRPWLSDDAMAPIYSDRQPVHPAGLGSFRKQCRGADSCPIGDGSAKLNAFLGKHVRPFKKYGEIGCPLWGLLPYYGRRWHRIGFGLLEMSSWATVLGRPVQSLAVSQGLKAQLMRKLGMIRPVPTPDALYWIRHELSTFWSQRCVCTGSINLLREGALVEVDASADVPDGPLDVLMMIRFLDHFQDPAAALSEFARKARFVFVWQHSNTPRNWVIQHLVTFSLDGLSRLADRSGFDVVAPYPVPRDGDDEFGLLLKSRIINV